MRPGKQASALGRASLIALALNLWGCAVPVAWHTEGRLVDKTEASSIVPGTTTREEILKQLGRPAHVWDRPRVIGYEWRQVRELLLIGAMGLGSENLSYNRAFFIQFDSDDRVVRCAPVPVPKNMSYYLSGQYAQDWLDGKNTWWKAVSE
jgi:hypothetical protein